MNKLNTIKQRIKSYKTEDISVKGCIWMREFVTSFSEFQDNDYQVLKAEVAMIYVNVMVL